MKQVNHSPMFFQLNDIELSFEDVKEIERLLSFALHDPPELEDMWRIMDLVWDELRCDCWHIDQEKLAAFYQHPVWILNGLFIEQHDLSLQHRAVISEWIVQQKGTRILDFGGGFGTLARMIAEKNPQAVIDIYEPYPCQYALSKTQAYPNIHFITSFTKQYDCVVSMDVLEHVLDPLALFARMVKAVEPKGTFIIAKNFYPVIKCHLPATFYLRDTFDMFAKAMGLHIIGHILDNYVTIYRKTSQSPINWRKIRIMEGWAKLLFLCRELKQRNVPIWNVQFFDLLKAFIRKVSGLR